jgi:DNA-binding transcriptional ArsR family regulator
MKTDFRFSVGLRFEIFMALETLLDPTSRIHNAWKQETIQKLPAFFFKSVRTCGLDSKMWVTIGDALQETPVDISIDTLLDDLRNIPIENFQRNILTGALHIKKVVDLILKKGGSLPNAIKSVPKTKHEWLIFIGAYPYKKEAPFIIALEKLIRDPEKFREQVVATISKFWAAVFEQTWNKLIPRLEESVFTKRRIFEINDLDEFARHALIRIEVDEKQQEIKALRGGFKLPLQQTRTCTFLPSVFNDRRYWTCYRLNDGTYAAYFPYFEPLIPLTVRSYPGSAKHFEPELDPFLILKALGDTTRFQIIVLLAESSLSSTQLSKRLALTKATVSHHVHILREAGLLDEEFRAGSVFLNVRREVILVLKRLYK